MNSPIGVVDWLKVSGLQCDSDGFYFEHCPEKGWCCKANKDYNVGDLIFAIPRRCLIGVGNALVTQSIQNFIAAIDDLGRKSDMTAELLIILYMYLERLDQSSEFHLYLTSLSNQDIPSVFAWGNDHQALFSGTNLYTTCQKTMTNLEKKLELVHAVGNHLAQSKQSDNNEKKIRTSLSRDLESCCIHDLIWAYSHYISRRYPGQFASTFDVKHAELNRDADTGNLGCLCPLLDILNHDPSQDWLILRTDQDHLQIICNHPVKKGSEMVFVLTRMTMTA